MSYSELRAYLPFLVVKEQWRSVDLLSSRINIGITRSVIINALRVESAGNEESFAGEGTYLKVWYNEEIKERDL